MINKEETKSRDLPTPATIVEVKKITKVEELQDFVAGETRRDILDAVSKRILRLRGGVTCNDVLENLRAKGYKV
jgi:hypothetical protein